MTPARMKVCSNPGCPKRFRGTGKCPDCKRTAELARGTSTERGYGRAWERLRRAFISQNPICEVPGCLSLTTDVDHIDGLGPNSPGGFSWDNLRPFCHSHHSQRTARDQPGGWNRR